MSAAVDGLCVAEAILDQLLARPTNGELKRSRTAAKQAGDYY